LGWAACRRPQGLWSLASPVLWVRTATASLPEGVAWGQRWPPLYRLSNPLDPLAARKRLNVEATC